MELIEIISRILVYGGSLLVIVIMISFVLSRTKTEEETYNYYPATQITPPSIIQHQRINTEQKAFRKNQTVSYPQIFQLDNNLSKEIKIIRKPTLSKRDVQKEMRFDTKHLSKTNGNGTRYTIVNDEMKRTNHKAANFYL